MAEYIVYYKHMGESEGFEVDGYKRLQEQLRLLHSTKASDIGVYRKGRNFEQDHDDVILTNYR